MFVDSASRLQRPYGTRDKSAAAVLAVVKRFIADMGVPQAFRSENGAENTNHSFVEYCNNLGIRRGLTAPYTPQQNGPVESALWRAFKAGYAARLGISNIPGRPRERGQGFYGRGSDEFVDGVTAVGIGVLQSIGYRGK